MPADSSCPGLVPASSMLARLPRLKLRGVHGSALVLVVEGCYT